MSDRRNNIVLITSPIGWKIYITVWGRRWSIGSEDVRAADLEKSNNGAE